jgi:hypothetical protein
MRVYPLPRLIMTTPEMSSTVVAANADGETITAQRAISQHEMRIQVSMAGRRGTCGVEYRTVYRAATLISE